MLFGGDIRKGCKKAKQVIAKFKREAEIARCKANGESPPEPTSTKFRKFIGKLLPPLRDDSRSDPKNCYERMYSPASRENEVCRIIGTFLACQVAGALFYTIISFKYTAFPKPTGTWTSVGVHIALCAVILFPTLRAILLLAIPSLITSKARTIILIIVVTWALQGPATNITLNIRKSAEAVNCIQENVKSLAKELKDSAGSNLGQLPMKKIQSLIAKHQDEFNQMNENLRALDNMIQKAINMQREVMEKLKDIFQNCNKYALQPYQSCVAKMTEMHRDCLENAPLEALCKPVEFLRERCELTKILTMQCEWPGMLKNYIVNGVGKYVKDALKNTMEAAKETVYYDLYDKTKNKTDEAGKSLKSIEIHVNHSYSANQKVNYNIKEFERRLKDEIAVYEKFIEAIVYLIRFVRSEKVDNYYITAEFRKIDIARETNGQPTLIPLLPKEKDKYIDAWDSHMVPKEKMRLTLAVVLTLLSAAVPAVLIVVDILSYKVMDQSYGFFSSNSTRLSIPSMYRMKVSGEGILNEILAAILATFEPLTRESDLSDVLWRECFNEPNPPDFALFQLMFILFIVCIGLCVLQVYVKRTRHRIALHYFPNRARPRALYLYASVLESRKHLLDQMIKTAKTCEDGLAADEREGRGNLIYKGLPMMSSDTHRCLRCARTDLKISDASCKGLYCVDCYTIRKKCLDCSFPLQKIAENVEFYVDSSCSDEDDAAVGAP
ncbi:CRE-SPE-42 protein [Aphelenchoides avenae]|nr:CRE-SPE-42 protein [Aphelenchus avenae]